MPCPNLSSLVSIRCKRPRRRNVDRSTGPGPEWCSGRELPSSHWKRWIRPKLAGAGPLCKVPSGYGFSTDNHHLTQPDPSGVGPRRAMEQALQSAGLDPGDIDYINAHGTATAFNDAAEGTAIAQLFGRTVPVSSTESMMGHSLGAAGAVEAVICLLAMEHDLIPANLNFREPDEHSALNIVANQSRRAPLRTTLSNSFGFGGTNASIVMQRWHE